MRKTKKRYYIAYGSNLNLDQMIQRCPSAQIAGTSIMKDWRLLFRGGGTNAVATAERCLGESVPVLIWQIQSQDEAALDSYEGWPKLYRKEMLQIELNGKTVDAMIYIMNEVVPYGVPSPYYYNIIREGYITVGFDTGILQKAVFDSVAEMYKC